MSLFVLIPKAKETLEEYIEEQKFTKSGWTDMPYAFACVWISYSFLLLIEKVVFDTSNGASHNHGHQHSNDHISRSSIKKDVSDKTINNNEDENLEEETLRNVISNKGKLASFLHRQSGK